MRSLKVLLSHPCPYPLCHSIEPHRRNVQPPKDLRMKIRQGRDSWSHLSPFSLYSSVKLYHNYFIWRQRGHSAPPLNGVSRRTVKSEWCVLIIQSLSEFMNGQTDISRSCTQTCTWCCMWLVSLSFASSYRLLTPSGDTYSTALIHGTVGLCSEQKTLFYIGSGLAYLFFLCLIGYGSAFHSRTLCSLAFEAMVHFKAIPRRVNGWDHMGLRRFRMANPAESVISSQTHQFGVWNTAPGESDSLGDSWQELKGLGISSYSHLDKTGISQSASKTWSKARKEE